jgi:hypothetical protein
VFRDIKEIVLIVKAHITVLSKCKTRLVPGPKNIKVAIYLALVPNFTKEIKYT